MSAECLFCGKTARYTCEKCGDPFCGHCSRKVVVFRLGSEIKQRLCALCVVQEQDNDNTQPGNSRYYTIEQAQKCLDTRIPQEV